MKGLVLNLGLKGIRAIIFGENGKISAHSYRRISTHLNQDCVEQDPQEWWEKGQQCIREALQREKDPDFVTVTASAACVLPVTKEGRPLMRTVMVSDKRATEEAATISQLASFKEIPYPSGAYYTLPRILWIKKNLPEIYRQTHHFISPNDFFIHKLTGQFFIDPFNATKYYTIDNQYPQKLLSDLGVERSKLPPIKPMGSCLPLSEKACELGLKLGTKVVLTTYDSLCAFFGSGPSEEGDACDMSGTVTSLRTLTKKSLSSKETRIFEQKYNDWNIIGGSNNLGGGLIEWVLEIFPEKNAHDDLEKLNPLVAAEKGIIFLPYLLGERAPLWDDHVRGAFLGIERFHTKEDLARAVLESTGFLLRQLLETIESNGIVIKRLFVSGGLAKLDVINQIKADITGRDIVKIKETESTAFGAYSLARQSLDPSYDRASNLEVEKIYYPDPRKHELYCGAYQLFTTAYDSLKLFHRQRHHQLKRGELQQASL